MDGGRLPIPESLYLRLPTTPENRIFREQPIVCKRNDSNAKNPATDFLF
jgi:hypothetical protein